MRTALTCLLALGLCVVAADGIGPTRAASVPDSLLLPPGSGFLSDAAAAERVERSSSEPRKGNRRANSRMPTRAELARFRRASRGQGIAGRVTGRFTGTTGDIIEWAAHKWGVDPELLKAQAVVESSWKQKKRGDGGRSFGLMQIKRTVWRGSYPLSARSTAFNVDLAAAILRQAYDGRATWYRPEGYRKGDLENSLGSYYSGRWRDAEGRDYVMRVWRELAARTWAQPGF